MCHCAEWPAAHSASLAPNIADGGMSEFAYWDHSPELSRRFRALKIWLLLKLHGAAAIHRAIDDNIAVAAHLAAAVDASEDFERVAPAPLSIVCFRYRGRGLAAQPAASVDSFNLSLIV